MQYSLITLAVVIALAALLGWIVAGRVLRPVHRITGAARAASERNLSARVGLRGPRDELHELAETFDDMLDRLQSAFDIGALLIPARNERGLTVHALEPAVVSGDPVLVERLVADFVDNADGYNTAAGDIWISTRIVAGNGELIVANTGTLTSPADADLACPSESPFPRPGHPLTTRALRRPERPAVAGVDRRI